MQCAVWSERYIYWCTSPSPAPSPTQSWLKIGRGNRGVLKNQLKYIVMQYRAVRALQCSEVNISSGQWSAVKCPQSGRHVLQNILEDILLEILGLEQFMWIMWSSLCGQRWEYCPSMNKQYKRLGQIFDLYFSFWQNKTELHTTIFR